MAPEVILPKEKVDELLKHNNRSGARPDGLHYFSDLQEMFDAVCTSERWSRGETFVCVLDAQHWLILHQITLFGALMLPVTPQGHHGLVSVGPRAQKDHLVEQFQLWMNGQNNVVPKAVSAVGIVAAASVLEHAVSVTEEDIISLLGEIAAYCKGLNISFSSVAWIAAARSTTTRETIDRPHPSN